MSVGSFTAVDKVAVDYGVHLDKPHIRRTQWQIGSMTSQGVVAADRRRARHRGLTQPLLRKKGASRRSCTSP
jgi:hypothetical protein